MIKGYMGCGGVIYILPPETHHDGHDRYKYWHCGGQASNLVVELDSKLGEAGAVKSHLEEASSVITQLQSQLKAERERMSLIEKARDEAIKDQKEVSFALKDEIEKNAALSNQLLKLQKGFDAAQQVVAETTQQLQAARNEAHHLQSALAHTQVSIAAKLLSIFSCQHMLAGVRRFVIYIYSKNSVVCLDSLWVVSHDLIWCF